MNCLFGGCYRGKRVLVTGHTGFKGSWLALWLESLGARVFGYSLTPPTSPNHFELLDFTSLVSEIGDIRRLDDLMAFFSVVQPDIVFHLAAQPLVGYGYQHPAETFEVNVMGSVNVLEAARRTKSVRAIVNITSDKCYENREWVWGYREIDPMGGRDPYSASKGCAELVSACYQRSFFSPSPENSDPALIASARAGNVIGGGDWGARRLVPDIMTAAAEGRRVYLRSPFSIRPWQHVLEAVSGYLLLGWKLLEESREFAEAWNFGPDDADHQTVLVVAEILRSHWERIDYHFDEQPESFHEARVLKLDCSKARALMKWKPVWSSRAALEKTAAWYRRFYDNRSVATMDDMEQYIRDAKRANLVWANP